MPVMQQCFYSVVFVILFCCKLNCVKLILSLKSRINVVSDLLHCLVVAIVGDPLLTEC